MTPAAPPRRSRRPARRLAAFALSLAAALLPVAAPAQEPLARSLFGAAAAASPHLPEAIGSHSRGCAAGLVQLPESGPTWQAMRLSRNRNWGHPEMIRFLTDLSETARQIGWPGLYIGDISQPRGGPMTSSHVSHQTGLDADIWMLPPRRLDLSRQEREGISSISVRTEDQTRTNGNWSPQHHALLRAAALDPRVDRIFVTPPAKIAMCNATPRRDRGWLQKIRPITGHNTHFHVRLKCPAGNRACEAQNPTVAELSNNGDGCDESLNWWVTTYLEELRNPPRRAAPSGPPPRNARTYTMSDLPGQCGAVLTAR